MSVSSFNSNSTINNTFKLQKFSEENNSETFDRGIFAARDIASITKTVVNVNKGKSFWEMSLTQKFVFGLGLISGVGGSNIVQKSNDCSSISQHPKDSQPSDVSYYPENSKCSKLYVYTLSDIIKNPLTDGNKYLASFGMQQQREYIEIYRFFSRLSQDISCINDLYDIAVEARDYMNSRCEIFSEFSYKSDMNQFIKKCHDYNFTSCQIQLIDSIENFQKFFSEAMKLISARHELPPNLEIEFIYLLEAQKSNLAKIYHVLKLYIDNLHDILNKSFININSPDRESFELHDKQVRSILDKSKAIYKKCDYRRNMKLSTFNKGELLNIDKNTCFIDLYIEESKELIAMLQKYREKISGKYINKIKQYLLDSFTTVYFISGLFIAKFVWHNIRGGNKNKKTKIKLIIKQLPIEPIDNFEQKIKQYEEGFKKTIPSKINRHNYSQTDTPITVARIETFIAIKPPINNIKNGKKSSSSNSVIKEQKNTENANFVIQDIPKYPWGNIDIPFNSSHIKPIHYNGKIAAYAYFDPESLDGKFTEEDKKKMEEIHVSGNIASHCKSATGYKIFQHKKQKIWEFKIAGKNRLYGVPIKANNKGQEIKIAPLVIFDISLRKKLGGDD